MSDKSRIEWTDATWNPVRGCSRVSEGCRNCYAERHASRFSGPGQPYDGFATSSRHPWRPGLSATGHWTGVVRLIPEMLSPPLRWKRPRRIFVNSMSDLYHEALDFKDIAAVYGVMAWAGLHTFQVLTKRPERRLAFMRWMGELTGPPDAHGNPPFENMKTLPPRLATWPLPNVWEGVSVEDQGTADERIPLLLQTPAAKRFVSYEPALGPVDFSRWVQATEIEPDLDWLIVGGESGPGARPFDVAWARSTVATCREAGVPVFVKQMGRWCAGDPSGFLVDRWRWPDGHVWVLPIIGETARRYEGGKQRPDGAECFGLCDSKGGDPGEWPEDLRVREMPA